MKDGEKKYPPQTNSYLKCKKKCGNCRNWNCASYSL